jgi:hypothetical protein
MLVAALNKTDPVAMTQLIRDASNWAFQLDLQQSKTCFTLFYSKRYHRMIHLSACAGAQQLRADQLGMLDDV